MTRRLALALGILVVFALTALAGCDCGSDSSDDGVDVDDDDDNDDDNAPDDDDDDDNDDDDDDDDNDDNDDDAFCDFDGCPAPDTWQPVFYRLLEDGLAFCGDVDPDDSFPTLLRIQDALDARPALTVPVAVGEVTDLGTYHRYELVFDVPLLGLVRAYLHVPDTGAPPYPAVLMTHGHAGNPLDTFSVGGEALVNAGFVVLTPEVRSLGPNWDGTRFESDWERMVFQVMPFDRTGAGLLVYQMTLMIDYLASLTDVDSTRLGAWGHSGGSFWSINMMGLDNRLKTVTADLLYTFAEPEDGCDIANPWEDKIPRLFCWGGGQRVLDLVGDRLPETVWNYGYPGDDLAGAIAEMTAHLTAPVDCGNAVCGPGESDATCPADCAPPPAAAAFAPAADPLVYDWHDYGDPVVHTGTAFWAEAAGPPADPAADLRTLTALSAAAATLDCLPPVTASSTQAWHGHTCETAEFCFGDLGPVTVESFAPAHATDGAPPLVILADAPLAAKDIVETDLIAGALDAGHAVLRVELPLIGENSRILDAATYGLSLLGFRFWQIDRILAAQAQRLGTSVDELWVYGNFAGAFTAYLMPLLDARVTRVAAGLLWPTWEPGLPTDYSRFHAADELPGAAALGTFAEVTAAMPDVEKFAFDPYATNTADVLAFFGVAR